MTRYLDHKDIDKKKWDDCIEQSANRMPYALSWWLDAVCPEWKALISDDYRAVMPLTHGHKYGIDYLYQPYFTQQLGIFSANGLSGELVSEFTSKIPEKYRYIRIQFNTENRIDQKEFSLSFRKNFLLDLTPDAPELAASYHRNCRRNVQKAIHAGITVRPGPGATVFTHYIRRHLDKKLTGSMSGFYPALNRVTLASILNGTGEIKGAYSLTGELLAVGWFITTLGRCLFQVCASTPKGRQSKAMYLLVDHMIMKHAGTGLVFDFAGSNIPGIAYPVLLTSMQVLGRSRPFTPCYTETNYRGL